MVPEFDRRDEDRRVILLRTLPSGTRPSRDTQPMPVLCRDLSASVEASRHYLKFMLPSIPIATFVLSFIVSYLMAGLGATPMNLSPDGKVNAALPLLGALLIGLTTAALCMWIYFGFLRVSGIDQRNTRSS